MSLTACLKKAGDALPTADRAAILSRARQLREEGQTAKAAAVQAVSERLEAVNAELKPLVMEAARKPAAETVVGKVEDFGEKLEGARKDLPRALDRELTDEALATEPFGKIWPADDYLQYEDPYVAAVSFAARAEVTAKPRVAYKLKRWVEQVKGVRELARKVADGKISKDSFQEKMRAFRGLDQFANKVAVLEQMPRDQWKRVGKVGYYPDAYSYAADGAKVAKPYGYVEIDGKTWKYEGTTLDGLITRALANVDTLVPTEQKMKFEVRGREGAYFINKAGDREYRKLAEFKTSKEALAYRNSNYADLVAAWEGVKDRDNVKEKDLRREVNRPRTGADYRKGKDVTPEQFQEAFGFRGGQFGNWVNHGEGAKERQGMLNQAYDALMDLASLVGIPPKAVSLNGSLGIAFGARGHGWASAHFEPGNLVINLTKTRGAGALAHEWFHALDNYFARMRGGEVKMGAGGAQGYREANFITYRPEPMMVHTSGRSKMTKAELERRRAENPQAGFYKPENWSHDPAHPMGVRPEVEKRWADLVKALNDSPMAARARSIDKAADGYWSQIIERGARSFENVILSKMMAKGFQNDYLANVVGIEDFPRDKARYPYLLPDEVAPIEKAVDELFGTLETKDTDKGVALFARQDASIDAQEAAPSSEFWRKIKSGETFTPQEAAEAYAAGARGTERTASGVAEAKTGLGASQGRETVQWAAEVAGFDGYRTVGVSDGAGMFAMGVIPNGIASPNKVGLDEAAVVTYRFIRRDDGSWQLDILDPKPGGRAFDELQRRGRLEDTGNVDPQGQPYYRTVLDSPYRESRAFLQEAIRRLAIHTGTVPTIVQAGRDTGARAGSRDARTIGPDKITTKFSRDADDRFEAFRRSTAAGALPIEKVRSIVEELVANWGNQPPIRIVADVEQLRREAGVNAPPGARGYYNGTAWIVAGAQRNRDGVARTLAHEAIAHHGLEQILGPTSWFNFQRAMHLAIRAGNKPLKAAADWVDHPDNYGSLSAHDRTHEIAARVIEDAVDPKTGEFRPGYSWLKATWARVADWLRSIGIDVAFTQAELHGMLVMAQRSLETGQKLAGGGEVMVAAVGVQHARGDSDQTSATRSASTTGEPMRLKRFRAAGQEPGDFRQAYRDAQALTGVDLGLEVREGTDMPSDVPMRYIHADDAIEVNPAFASHPRWQQAQWMAEEILHAVDSIRAGRMLSAKAGALAEDGALSNEAAEHYLKAGHFSAFLRYPLGIDTLTASEVRAELFARLGVLYFGDPELMQRHLPQSYEAYHAAFALGADPRNIPGDDVSAQVWRARSTRRIQAGGGLGPRGSDGATPARSDRKRNTDPGLVGLYARLHRAFAADPNGGLVQFSQSPSSITDQTDTPAFRAWFGDSKVVDADGKPLVVYHGTPAGEIEQFKPGKDGGVFFTDKTAVADGYTYHRSGWLSPGDGAVYPAYLSLQNPLIIDAQGKRNNNIPVPWQQWNPTVFGNLPANAVTVQDALAHALKTGHDGLIVKNVIDTVTMDAKGKSTVYAVASPEQIKSAVSPGRFALADHTDLEREALERAGIRSKRSVGEAIRSGFDRAAQLLRDRSELWSALRQASLDQFHGIDRAVKAELGGLPTDQDPYVAARLANGGTSGVMRALLLHGQAQWSANGQHLEKVPGTKGLLDILAPLGDDLNDWFGWMVGNRAARLKAQGRENNLTDAQIKALQGLAKGKEAQFLAAAKEYAAFKRSVLDVAEKAGLIDPAGRAAWDHADHIPFYRQIDSKASFSATGRKGLAGQSSGIRVLKGGESALNDPMENLLMNFSRLIDASLKNNAIRKTVEVLKVTARVEKIGYDMAGALVPKAQVRKVLLEAGTTEAVLDAMPDAAFEGMAKLWAIQAPSDPDVVRVMVGGKPQFYRVADPLLLKALTSFVPFDFPGLFLARGAKRILTRMVTSTPDFMLRNFIRDSVASQGITRHGFNPAKSLQGILKSYTESGAFEPMLFAGASFQAGVVNAADPTGTAQAMRRALRAKGLSAASADSFLGTVMDAGLRGVEHYFQVSEAIENANREAVYEATMKDTADATAAAYEAKDLMDFSLRGSSAIYQLAADVLPFFNARVQGMYRLGRADPKRLMAMGTLMMVASLLLAMANDGEDWYEELEDWDKDTYWHFMIGGKHFRLPKPFELGVVFATFPERIGRALKGLDSKGKTAERAWANVRDQLAMDPVPQLFKPPLEVWGNKNRFRDRPIETLADEGKLPSARFNASTSDTARVASQAMTPVSDRLGLSPKALEHMVNGYFGTVGSYALGLSDMLVRKLEDQPARPELRLDDMPVVKSFYREHPARATLYESELYKMRDEVTKIANTVRAYRKAEDDARADALELREEKKLDVKKDLDNAAKQLANLRKESDEIMRDKTMTPAAKRRAIDALQLEKNALAKEVMRDSAVRAAR